MDQKCFVQLHLARGDDGDRNRFGLLPGREDDCSGPGLIIFGLNRILVCGTIVDADVRFDRLIEGDGQSGRSIAFVHGNIVDCNAGLVIVVDSDGGLSVDEKEIGVIGLYVRQVDTELFLIFHQIIVHNRNGKSAGQVAGIDGECPRSVEIVLASDSRIIAGRVINVYRGGDDLTE